MSDHKLTVLVLDDSYARHEMFIKNNIDCVVDSAYNCEEAFSKVMSNHYDIICFDHDLGVNSQGEYETSIPFARAVRELIDQNAILESTIMIVHTSNPVGGQNILSYFTRTPNETFKIPFAWTKKNLFSYIISEM